MPTEENRSVLRILSEGGVRLFEVGELLKAIENAYNGTLIFQQTLDALRRWERELPHLFSDVRHNRRVQDRRFPATPPVFGFWPSLLVISKRRKPVLLSKDSFDSLVSRQHRLVLVRVQLKSPGSWDIAGIGAALEVVRKFLSDRHERRKDREYREPLERERLTLENEILKTKAIESRIQLAKQLGATDEDLAPLTNELLFKPLDELGRFQDSGLITDAKLLESDDEGNG